MTYSELINGILSTRGRFGVPEEEYKERHHIVPKCLGGKDDEFNLIDLYAREHFEAHRLLALENPNEKGLIWAWWNMSHVINNSNHERYRLTAKEYEEARVAFSKLQSGRVVSEETKEKHRQDATGVVFTEERKQHIRDAKKNISKETREKLSMAKKESGTPSWFLEMGHEARKKKVFCDGTVFNSQIEFAEHYKLRPNTVTCMLNNLGSYKKGLPKKWVDMGLCWYKEDKQWL